MMASQIICVVVMKYKMSSFDTKSSSTSIPVVCLGSPCNKSNFHKTFGSFVFCMLYRGSFKSANVLLYLLKLVGKKR